MSDTNNATVSLVKPAKAATPKKAKVQWDLNKGSMTYGIRLAVAKKPDISLADLVKHCADVGITSPASTIATIRTDALMTIKACIAAGRFADKAGKKAS